MPAQLPVHTLSYQECLALLKRLHAHPPADGSLSLEPAHHCLRGLDHTRTPLFTLQMPPMFEPIQLLEAGVQADGTYTPLPVPEPLHNYLARLSATLPHGLILLLQAGRAALGFFEGEKLTHHKVIRRYMTRKKQGKSQLNYLKTQGKSRAGSRIRLHESAAFFEDINERLHTWDRTNQATRIFYAASPSIWGMLFQTKRPCPFDKDDPRLHKIPVDVHPPTYEELLRIHRLLQCGQLILHQPNSLTWWFDDILEGSKLDGDRCL